MTICDELILLCNNIKIVYKKDNKDINWVTNFSPILFKHKYSSSLDKTIRLKSGNDIIPIEGYIVEYICPNCKNLNTILLKKFLSKSTILCKNCRENDDKRKKQSEYAKSSFLQFGKMVSKERENILSFKDLSNEDKIKKSILLFNNESDDFKKNYFKLNLTEDEFEKVKNKIEINGVDISKSIYYPFIKNNSSNKYSMKLLDNKGKFNSISTITYKCDACNKKFNGRYLKERSSQYKILCRECLLCNKSFKIRYIENIENNKVRYQSKPELDLINYCNDRNILIENGPYVPYTFNGKSLIYRVDFKIKNFLIEIKDEHIWHKNEVESGKWDCKEKSAIEYCKINNLVYKLIFKNDINLIKSLIE